MSDRPLPKVTFPAGGRCNNQRSVTSCECPRSNSMRRVVPIANEVRWGGIAKHLVPMLDARSILMLRQTCNFFHRYKAHPHGAVLRMSGFRNMCMNTVWNDVLPILCRKAISPAARQAIALDFSRCTLLRDLHLAILCEQFHGEDSKQWGRLAGLRLDHCRLVTDKGLEALLSTKLPYLKHLSLRATGSRSMTGSPFNHLLTAQNWPSLRTLDIAFTRIPLPTVEKCAQFLKDRCAEQPTAGCKPGLSLSIVGSWASRRLFEVLELCVLKKAFCGALRTKDADLLARLTKRAQSLVDDKFAAAVENGLLNSALSPAVSGLGSKLLVNLPLLAPGTCDEDAKSAPGSTPLSMAVEWGPDCDRALQVLLKRGAQVNVPDCSGKTILFRVCEGNNLSAVKMLLDFGALINPHSHGEPAPLNAAIQSGSSEIFMALLRRDVDIGLRRSSNQFSRYRTPLLTACEKNNPEMIHALLKRGADPHWSPSQNGKLAPAFVAFKHDPMWLDVMLGYGLGGRSADLPILLEILTHSISKGYAVCVDRLLQNHSSLLHLQHARWSFPHFHAAKLGNSKILRSCLKHGSDVDAAAGDRSCTALHVAAEEGHTDCVCLLLDHGCAVNSLDKFGRTALHLACLEDQLGAVGSMVQHGADVNTTDLSHDGESPLMTCIRTRHISTAIFLMESAPTLSPNLEDCNGRTALAYALFFGQHDVAVKLLEIGADIQHADRNGRTPFAVLADRATLTGCADKNLAQLYFKHSKPRGRRRMDSESSRASHSVTGEVLKAAPPSAGMSCRPPPKASWMKRLACCGRPPVSRDEFPGHPESIQNASTASGSQSFEKFERHSRPDTVLTVPAAGCAPRSSK